MQIGQKIYNLRKTAGITQEQLASQLNVSRQTVSKWEAETTLPDIESVVAISRLFGVSLDELLIENTEDNMLVKSAEDNMPVENTVSKACTDKREKDVATKTLEELARINRRNRAIILVVTGILLFSLGLILGSIFVKKLDNTTSQIEYTLHQYMELQGQASALIETNAKEQVLLVAEGTYDDGTGRQVAMGCEVYYTVNNKVKLLGTIWSAGTAYPIASDWNGIYTASGHSIERYEIDEKTGTLILAMGVYENFSTDGTAIYEKEVKGVRMASSEEEFMKLVADYGRATVVSFE